MMTSTNVHPRTEARRALRQAERLEKSLRAAWLNVPIPFDRRIDNGAWRAAHAKYLDACAEVARLRCVVRTLGGRINELRDITE